MNEKNQSVAIRSNSKIDTSLAVVALSFILAPVLPAVAKDWRFEPDLRVIYEYDDNATLNESIFPNWEIHGAILEARATVASLTPTSRFEFTPAIRSRMYDEDEFDSDDWFLELDFENNGERHTFSITGTYEDESIRTAERSDADPEVDDPGDIPGDASGAVLSPFPREKFRIVPEWSYDFSQRTAVSLSADYSDVDYDGDLVSSLTPYSDLRVRASLIREISPISAFHFRLGMREYDPSVSVPGVDSSIDGVALNLGYERNPTETSRFTAFIGAEETKPATGESETEAVWSLAYRKRTQTATFLASVRRNVNASGLGRLTLRDSINLSVRKSFSERFSGGLAIRAFSDDVSAIGTLASEDRDYLQVGLQLAYQLSRSLTLQGDYRYTNIDRSTVSGTADSNNLQIGLIYRPNPRPETR